ncbi:MAG TPA: sulfatase-like hydrolase/transferase [Bryobacteraceae bacterium]|nr:sulfatase-like hydrolase/transferase [Bryobacteraceae bacterium]
MQETVAVSTTAASRTQADRWKSLVVALSLANLCYLRLWSELLTYSRPDLYLMVVPYRRADYLAIMINVVLAGLAGWAVALLVERSGSRALRFAGRAVFLLLLLVPLNAVRSILGNSHELFRSPLLMLIGTRGTLLLGVCLALAVVFVFWRWPSQLVQLAVTVLLILSPLLPLNFGQAAWRLARYDAAEFRDATPPPPVGLKRTPRVVWVILDDWDQRLTFIDRPSRIRLPEIDRLRRESFYAANAYPPGSGTAISIPALTTGRPVTNVEQLGPAELMLRHGPGQPSTSWSREPNVFQAARAAGFDTALLGFFHPYCRVIPSGLTHCEWFYMSRQYNSMGATLPELVPNQTRSLFETSLFSLFGQSLTTIDHARTYRKMMPRAVSLATNPAYGLVFIHLGCPHPPHAFNSRTGRFDLKNSAIQGYADSLVLADRTVGQIRRALERAGMWDSSTVLFSTDHSYVSAEAFDGRFDPRIPFLLKMAGPVSAIDFQPKFNTLITSELLMSVLRSEVRTPQDAARWIEAHRDGPAQ